MSRRIFGVVSPGGRLSLNGNLYLPDALKGGDGHTIPLFCEHEDFEFVRGRATGNLVRVPRRGWATLHWNSDLQRLEFEGRVTDPALIEDIESGRRPFVSLAAQPTSMENFHGYAVPLGLSFFSLSVVARPGIPETSLSITESFHPFASHWMLLESGFITGIDRDGNYLDLLKQRPVIKQERRSAIDVRVLGHALQKLSPRKSSPAIIEKRVIFEDEPMISNVAPDPENQAAALGLAYF
jgi:hypothetical protein